MPSWRPPGVLTTLQMACAALATCADCIRQFPPPGVDTGLRCVWCDSSTSCREYNKFSLSLPCADALRGGGGYPGGPSCEHAGRTKIDPGRQPAAALPHPPFVHQPRSAQPVSVVVPSFARPNNLHHQLIWLLQLEPLHRSGSEVLISHGSRSSWEQRSVVDGAIADGCAGLEGRGCAASPVRHLDSAALNDEYFTAHRFFAARASRNEVLLHMDDDLVVGEAMLQALIDAVVAEPGFPDPPAPGLHGPSGFGRACSAASGYQRGRGADPSAAIVLTNLAATSKSLNERYLRVFNLTYAPVLQHTRGNGEDLTYSQVARQAGGPRQALGGCDAQAQQRDACATASGEYAYLAGAVNPRSGGAFHTQKGHSWVRGRLCRCLATHDTGGGGEHVGRALMACLTGNEELSVSQSGLHSEL